MRNNEQSMTTFVHSCGTAPSSFRTTLRTSVCPHNIPTQISGNNVSSVDVLRRKTCFISSDPYLSSFTASGTKYANVKAKTKTKTTVIIMADRVVIAGGTGFVGTRLAKTLISKGASSVVILSRSSSGEAQSALQKIPGVRVVLWNTQTNQNRGKDGNNQPAGWQKELENADAVINLCGETIVTRWTDKTKRELESSRISAVETLSSAIAKLDANSRPKAVISASAVGYYGTSVPYQANLTEDDSPGNDFLARLCVRWENEALAIQTVSNVRTCVLRFGIVLGKQGGALAKMMPAFQFFVGGPLGSGQQWVPWVHIDDVVASIIACIDDPRFVGIYNCTAPNPVTMKQMTDSLANAMSRPNLFPVPGFVLETVLGEASSVLLTGQRVKPKRLMEKGFIFQYPDIDTALQSIVRES